VLQESTDDAHDTNAIREARETLPEPTRITHAEIRTPAWAA